MKTICLIVVAIVVLLAGTACSAPTLMQDIVSASDIVVVIADPAIAPLVEQAAQSIVCAAAPGTTTEKIDSCLAAALQLYQEAATKASPKQQALVQAVVLAIESFITAQAPAGTITNSSGAVIKSTAKAQVRGSATLTAKQFKQQFNAAAKIAGTNRRL